MIKFHSMGKLLSFPAIAAVALLCNVEANAQSNGLNPIYSVNVQDLQYNIVEKKATVGSVLGAVVDAMAGQASDNNHKEMVPQVNAAVKEAFSKTYRLTPLDNGEVGNFTLTGEVTQLSTTTNIRVVEEKDSKGNVTKRNVNDYIATANISLSLKDNETGEVGSNTFTGTSNWLDVPKSETEALSISINKVRDKVASYYNSLFPLSANIIERGTEKKDKAKEVYIDLGENNGIYKGQHFTVYIVGTVAGRETRSKVGRVKVLSVEGDDISLCKVQSGGKDIKSAFDAGSKLVVVSGD